MASITNRRLLLTLRPLSLSFSASAILNPSNPTAPLTARQKSRLAVSLLKSEKNPDTILSICRAAALTPDTHLDRLAFSSAVSALAASSSFVAIRSLLPDLLDLANPRHRSHAIVLFGQAGLLDDARKLFDEMRVPNVACFNSLLFAGVLAKKHGEVERMFKEFPKSYAFKPDLDSFNMVILSFCESGSSRSVHSMIEEMGRRGIKPNLTTYNTLVAGLYREGKVEEINKVLEIMMDISSCSPAVSTYNVMIQNLCKLNKSEAAKGLLEKMVSTRGMKPNSVTYHHLVHGFCKEGKLDEAKKLFFEMSKKGSVPDSKCYFTLIHYLCQGGEYEEALKICKQSMEKNWVPCFSIMKALVKGLVSRSKVEEAREIAGTVKQRFSNKAEMWKEVDEILA